MTHTRPSATVDATSWRAVGAGARFRHAGAAGTVVVAAGAVVAGGAALDDGARAAPAVEGGAAAGVGLPAHAVARISSKPPSRVLLM
jgi:hypothetical protein